MKKIFIAFGIAALTALGGCASSGSFSEYPIGIGPSPNALKRTPCACIKLPNLAQSEQG